MVGTMFKDDVLSSGGWKDSMKGLAKGIAIAPGLMPILALLAITAPAAVASDETLIVGFDEGVSKKEMRHRLTSAGAKPVRKIDLINAYEIEAVSGDERAMADELREKQGIEYVEDNPQLKLDALPNDTVWSQPLSELHWALHNDNFGTADADIDAAEAWDISTGSSGVTVATIDTGADYTHLDLRSNIWVNAGEVPGNGLDDDGDGLIDNVNGYDHGDNDPDPYDEGGSDTGHGTSVAGVIGAQGNNGTGTTGVSWNVSVMVLKFTGAIGSNPGQSRDVADMLAALDNAVREGVVVVNMSFGSAEACASQALQNGLNAAEAAGILIVASAGNDQANTDTIPHCPSGSPNSNIISVANTDENDNLTSTSNYGPSTIDLAAPGRHILSTVPGGYAYASGTSFSAPQVTGVAALIKSIIPQATASQIRAAILGAVDQKPQLTGLVATGGRLNAHRAMQVVDQAGPTATMRLNEGKKYSRKRKIAVQFIDAADSSGIGSTSFTVNGAPVGPLTPFAAASSIDLAKDQGAQSVQAKLVDRVGNSTSLSGKVTYDRSRPKRFRIKSVKAKRKRGRKTSTVVVKWSRARDKLSGIKKYRIYRGMFRKTSRKQKSKKKGGKKKRCHFRKAKVVSWKRRKTQLKVRSRGRHCIRIVAVDKAGNKRRSRYKKVRVR